VKRFLGIPTRGGWLTLLNCAFWAAFVLNDNFRGWPPAVLLALYFAFSLPLGATVGLWVASALKPREGTVAWCVAIGINCVAWGYGLSWLIGLPGRRREWLVRHHLCTHCGYNLLMTPHRCPECGGVPPPCVARSPAGGAQTGGGVAMANGVETNGAETNET
jgi:hypothetical protein